MESCLGEEIAPIVQLEGCLRDGVILARLARVFAPDLVPRIFEAAKLQFRHSDNINRFFRFVERCGLPDVPSLFRLT
jgi:Ras GTPase-activating-like protein IQGAP2/3